ncbi:WD repeat-containing protein 26 [Dorcoceras hygrometricum]|uniref:WD repeat-containing protein 26 n=1 Tax=Dorcoceras hygrometricum TaxID=472368 RepID=A0A2Z7BJD2_9LAMI|nr:WD repeat-containing protein 26 [Dorcoceras hygrometricum]
MASSLIANALQVNFDSVLGIPDNDGMVNMFRSLESTGLRGFLGCPSVLYEKKLEQFFDIALVKDNEIPCVIHGKVVAIIEDRFAGVFELPTEGLTDLLEVPKNLVFDARSLFSQSGEPVKTSCKMRKLKYEFRLLKDILAKSVTVKAGLFDAVTHERFVLMTEIHFELKVNWSKLMFDTLKEMADRSSKRAKGYAAQICVMLKEDPAVTLEEAKTFPPRKILSAIGTYVTTNKTIDARGESDEPDVAKVAVLKRKSVSKKRSAATANKDTYEVQVEIVVEKAVSKKRRAAASDALAVKKKRTTTGRDALTEIYLALVTVAQDEIIYLSGVLSFYLLTEMASSLIANALQVNFDSVLGIPDNDGMVNMFRSLESTGLRGFLGCPSVLYEKKLEQFFDIALVKDNEIPCVIHGKVVAIIEDRSLFSQSGEPVKTSCKMRKLKYEFRLLKDILAKSVTVKAGLFDAVTHERFVLMTEIHFELKVNWSKLMFDTLKEMADRSSKRAKGYAAQICVMLKEDPAVTLEEAKTFPPRKILSAIGTYVTTNKTIDARGESDEPDVAKVAVLKRKSVSKKRSAATANKDTYEVQVEIVVEKAVSKKRRAAASDAPAVKKKRTTTGRDALTEIYLALVTVAQDEVPIQIIEPISSVPAERPHAQKRKAPKRKLSLSTGSDDEIVEKELGVENVVEKQKEQTAVDDVDKILIKFSLKPHKWKQMRWNQKSTTDCIPSADFQ